MPTTASGDIAVPRQGTVKNFRALFDNGTVKKDKEKEKEESSPKEGKEGKEGGPRSLKLFPFMKDKSSHSAASSPATSPMSSPHPTPHSAPQSPLASPASGGGSDDTRKWKAKLDSLKADRQWKGKPAPPPSHSPRSKEEHHEAVAPPVVTVTDSEAEHPPHAPSRSPRASAGITPKAKGGAAQDFTVSQLICAFEQTLLNDPRADLSGLKADEWADLFKQQTMKKKAPKEKSSVFGLFGGKEDDEETKKKDDKVTMESVEEDVLRRQKETWDSLDAAKKKRRLQEFLKKRTEVKERLEEDLRAHAGQAAPSDDTDEFMALAAELPPPLLKVPSPNHKLELGTYPTTLESQLKFLALEDSEKGEAYYRDFFYGRDHSNFFGWEEKAGHAIVSIQGEGKGEEKDRAHSRVLVRTKEGSFCTFVPVESDMRSMLKAVCESNERLSSITSWKKAKDPELEKSLLGLEKQLLNKRSKIGVLAAKRGQEENDIYKNNEPSVDFYEFLDWLATKVTLEGWQEFAGGLDVKNNKTGLSSYYTKHRGIEIMFHVAPLLPYFPADPQQLERKRHIGNDIAAIVFLEDPDPAAPLDPSIFVSEFLHIFAFVAVDRAKREATGQTHYRLAFASREVALCMPIIPAPGSFPRSDHLRDFLLTKLLNAERGALNAPVFEAKMVRTRKQLLGDLANDFGGKSK